MVRSAPKASRWPTSIATGVPTCSRATRGTPHPRARQSPRRSAWTRHAIAPLEAFDAPTGFSNAFHTFAMDVNGDGWPDQVILGYPGDPATWRANPGPRGGPWRTHPLSASTGNESPAFARLIDGRRPGVRDGRRRAARLARAGVVAVRAVRLPSDQRAEASDGAPVCARARRRRPRWRRPSGRGRARKATGWPPRHPATTPWPFTAADLGPDAAHMAVYDVNGDGLTDIVASAAHQVGVWWFEQQRAGGAPHVRETRDRRLVLAVTRARRRRHRRRRHRRRGDRQTSLGAWTHGRPATQRSRRALLVSAAAHRPRRDVDQTPHRRHLGRRQPGRRR